MKQKYIISPLTSFDADIELYYTYILNNNEEKTFAFTAYGKTEKESREAANKLVLAIDIYN